MGAYREELGLTESGQPLQCAAAPGNGTPRGDRRRGNAMWYYDPDHPLRRLFAGLTEQTFMATCGGGDPPLVDYLSTLLSRFVHMDAVYRLRNAEGKQLGEVVDM